MADGDGLLLRHGLVDRPGTPRRRRPTIGRALPPNLQPVDRDDDAAADGQAAPAPAAVERVQPLWALLSQSPEQREEAKRRATLQAELNVLGVCRVCQDVLQRLEQLSNPRDRVLLFFHLVVTALDILGAGIGFAYGMQALQAKGRGAEPQQQQPLPKTAELTAMLHEMSEVVSQLMMYLADGDQAAKNVEDDTDADQKQASGETSLSSLMRSKMEAIYKTWGLSQRRRKVLDDATVTHLEIALLLSNVLEVVMGTASSMVSSMTSDVQVRAVVDKTIESVHDQMLLVIQLVNGARLAPDQPQGRRMEESCARSFSSAATSTFSSSSSSSLSSLSDDALGTVTATAAESLLGAAAAANAEGKKAFRAAIRACRVTH